MVTILSIDEIFFGDGDVRLNPKKIKLFFDFNQKKSIFGILKCPANKRKFLVREEIDTPEKKLLNSVMCDKIVISVDKEKNKITNVSGIRLDITVPKKVVNFLSDHT